MIYFYKNDKKLIKDFFKGGYTNKVILSKYKNDILVHFEYQGKNDPVPFQHKLKEEVLKSGVKYIPQIKKWLIVDCNKNTIDSLLTNLMLLNTSIFVKDNIRKEICWQKK